MMSFICLYRHLSDSREGNRKGISCADDSEKKIDWRKEKMKIGRGEERREEKELWVTGKWI